MPIASWIQRNPLDAISDSDGEAGFVLETIYSPPNRAISGCDPLSQGRDLSSQALVRKSGILYSIMQARHWVPRSNFLGSRVPLRDIPDALTRIAAIEAWRSESKKRPTRRAERSS
jgi:hypothetical protein